MSAKIIEKESPLLKTKGFQIAPCFLAKNNENRQHNLKTFGQNLFVHCCKKLFLSNSCLFNCLHIQKCQPFIFIFIKYTNGFALFKKFLFFATKISLLQFFCKKCIFLEQKILCVCCLFDKCQANFFVRILHASRPSRP